jgi:hypothetical protein
MSDSAETRTPMTAALAAYRAPFAAVLLAVGFLFGLLGLVALGTKTGLAARLAPGTEQKEAGKDESKPAEGPTDPEKQKAEEAAKVDYAVAGILGVFAGLGLIAVGVWAWTRPPGALAAADVRVALLAAGGSLGFFLMVLGLWLGYAWFQPLVDWIEKGDRREAKWPILAVAIFLTGGALAFVAAQPARAEERENPQLRRLVYGFNLGLSALLLLVALAAVNVFVSLRVPNALDTTEGGFYTFELSEATREYLAKLDRPVTAYVTIPREPDHISRETYRLLDACAAAAPDKFKVHPLTTADKELIERLAKKFPQSGLFDERGILLVAGADEAEYAFIRESDLSESNSTRGSREVFQGEAKLARELLFLAEGKVKAVVYFTTGSQELSIEPAGGRADRSASRLKAMLEKNNVDVRPLTAGLDETKVPDDATAVVVADPTGALPPTLVAAITKYMTSPRPTGKPGKLIVIAGPHPLPGNKGVAPTGLEDLLAAFGVRLVPGYLLNQPAEYRSYDVAAGVVNGKLLDDRNPIALAFGNYQIPFPHARPLQDLPSPNGKYQATPLFVTPANRFTWVEPDPVADPQKAVAAFRDNEALQKARDLSPKSRTLAVVVTEGAVGRAVVFGSGDLFDDKQARNLGTVPAELFANTVDWLRDRPAVANIANKTYGLYTPKPDGGTFRGEILPVGLVLFAVLGLGVGVWVTRRK